MNKSIPHALAIACALSGALLLIGVERHPYDYYVLMRFVVFCSGIGAAWYLFHQGENGWAALFGVGALLFNPFMPMHLRRSTWEPIDTCGAGIFAWGAVKLWCQRARVDTPR